MARPSNRLGHSRQEALTISVVVNRCRLSTSHESGRLVRLVVSAREVVVSKIPSPRSKHGSPAAT